MKKDKLKDKFLEELEKIPIVSVVCNKLGVARNTYYRWRKEDVVFNINASDCLDSGVDLVNDMAESVILNGIKESNMKATMYWLSHRHRTYRKPFIRPRDTDDLTEEQKEEKIREAKDRMKRFQSKWFKPEKP